jgi:hypothetical protein
MLAKLKQVAINYLTRPTPLGWLAIAIYFVLIAVLIRTFDSVDEPALQALILPCMGPAFLLGSFSQLKWQFANPRSALMPRFAAPHLAFPLAWAAVVLILWPLLISHVAQASLSFTLALVAVFTLVLSIWPGVMALLGMPIMLLRGSDEQRQLLQAWMNADGFRHYLLLLIAFAAWALLVLKIWREISLREDDLGYSMPIWEGATAKMSRAFRTSQTASLAKQSGQRWFGGSIGLDRAIRKAPRAPFWRRLDMIQPSAGTATPRGQQARSPGLILVVVVACAFWQLAEDFSLSPEAWATMVRMLPVVTLAAGLGAGVRLASRRPLMPFERLYPIGNQHYIDALIFGQARWALKVWATAHVVVIVATFALPWKEVDLPTASVVAVYALLTVAGLVSTFGVAVLCASTSGIFAPLVAGIFGILNTLVLQMAWASRTQREGNGLAPIWAAIAIPLGIMLIAAARNSWRQKELS